LATFVEQLIVVGGVIQSGTAANPAYTDLAAIGDGILGYTGAGTHVPELLTASQVTAFLNQFTSSLQGVAPASGGGTANFLRADGNWTDPPTSSGANPTATAGPAAVNGSATTFMRSDGAPAVQTATLSQLGLVKPDGTTIGISGGVISALAGFDSKPTVAYASTSPLPACTASGSGVGKTLTGNSNGFLVIDGVTTITADAGLLVLIAGQATASDNGWYTITTAGSLITAFVLTRTPGSDTSADTGGGYTTAVSAPSALTPGANNNGKAFLSTGPSPFTLDTSPLTFSVIGGAYTAGTGLQLSAGLQFSIDSTVVTLTGSQTLTNKVLTSPTMTTPVLGTPTSGNLINCTNVVNSLAGTANQITASASTGAITLTTPATFTAPGTIQDTLGMLYSTTAGVSAAGTTQGGAAALTTSFNTITTVGSGSGVALPAAIKGMRVVIVNLGANTLKIYPASGGAIDSASTNAAVTLTVNTGVTFEASSTTQWYTVDQPLTAGAGVTLTPGNGGIAIAATIASANPSASIGLTAVNGTAGTFMTSDSAPALSQAIAPTWTGQHAWTYSPSLTVSTNASAILTNPGTVTYTGGGTASTYATANLSASTLTASTSTTVTNAATLLVPGPPTASGSVTITHPWAIQVNSGNVSFAGTGNVLGTITSGNWNGSAITPAFLATDGVTTYASSSSTLVAQGLIATCLAASALPTNTYSNGSSGVGATLTASANGVLTVDSHAVALGDYVLVTSESTAANNGLYKCTTAGAAGAKYVLTRAVQMDTAFQFGGLPIWIAQGTFYSGGFWTCSTINPTIGTTNITFGVRTAAGTFNTPSQVGSTPGLVAQSGQSLTYSGATLNVTNPITAYAQCTISGTTLTQNTNNNLTLARTGTGIYTATFGAAYTYNSGNYCALFSLIGAAAFLRVQTGTETASGFTINCFNSASTAADCDGFSVAIIGLG
jgi:hypothetical protein